MTSTRRNLLRLNRIEITDEALALTSPLPSPREERGEGAPALRQVVHLIDGFPSPRSLYGEKVPVSEPDR
jgi:hypothetical protein